MELDSFQHGGQLHSKEKSSLLFAVPLSLFLHGILIAALWNNTFDEEQESLPNSVQIQLIPTNPLNRDPAEAVVIEPEPLPAELDNLEQNIREELAIDTPPTQSPDRAPQNEIVLNSDVDLPQLEIEPALENTEPQNESSAESGRIVLPSVVSVQNTLDLLQSRAPSLYWLEECNPLQKEESTKDCATDGAIDYQALQNNEVYRSLNPVRLLSRSQQTLGALGSLSADLSDRLDASSLPLGMSNYVMEELEAGISINSGVGNRQLQQIRRMIDQSAAAQQAERVMADPWVQQQYKELNQRKVVNY